MNKHLFSLAAFVFVPMATAAVFALIVGHFAITVDPASEAQQAFEDHLQALDESRWEDAQALVDLVSCGPISPEGAKAALDALRSSGETFSSAFQVTDIWIHGEGKLVLLGLDTPPGLPQLQSMRKIDGEWRIMCRN